MKTFNKEFKSWEVNIAFEEEGIVAFDIMPCNAEEVLKKAMALLNKLPSYKGKLAKTFKIKDKTGNYVYIIYDIKRHTVDDAQNKV